MFTLSKNFMLKIDEESATKSKSGLYVAKEGNDFDRLSKIATVDIPYKTSKYKKGDKVIFFHTVLNNKTDYFANHPLSTAKRHCYGTDAEIVAYFDGEELKSHDRIICDYVYEETVVLSYKKKEILPQTLKVIYSPFKSVKKGDTIITTLSGGYRVEELKKRFVPLDRVLLINGEPIEDHILVEDIPWKEYSEVNGILVKNENINKLRGKVIKGDRVGEEVLYIKRRGRVFEQDGKTLVAVNKKDILATQE